MKLPKSVFNHIPLLFDHMYRSRSPRNYFLRRGLFQNFFSNIFYLSKIFPTLAAFASLFSWRALYPCRSSKTCILNSFGLTQKDHKYTQGHRHRHHRPVHLLLHVLLLDLSLHYLLLLVRWTTVEDTPDICHRHSGGDGVIIFSLKSKNRKLKLEMSIFHAIL